MIQMKLSTMTMKQNGKIMATFNKFENQISEIIEEAFGDTLNDAQKALQRMTPGSQIFDGPGHITNKYESGKGYYPNIRSGFGGLINVKLDKASQIVIDNITKLKSTYSKVLRDPTKPIDPSLKPYITENFSSDYIEKEIESFNKSIAEVKALLDNLQGFRTPNYVKLYNLLVDFQKTYAGQPAPVKNKQPDPRKAQNAQDLLDQLNVYIQDLDNSTNIQYTSMSFGQRAHLSNAVVGFKEGLEEWQAILKAHPYDPNPRVVVDKEPPVGQFLDRDGRIYRNLWGDFLDTLLNAVVGASQRGWGTGPDVHSLLYGGQKGKASFRGSVKYSSADVATISPEIQKKFHEGFMTKFFLNPRILIYCTPEQWKSISEGGRLFKAATATGQQAWTAGQNRPKVSL